MKVLTQFKKYTRRDEGIALALVLMMTFLFGMWVVSVAFLTQSGSMTLKTNLELGQQRANIVNDGIAQVLAELTKQESENFKRYGVALKYANSTSGPCESLPNGGILKSTIDNTVEIQCTQDPESGKTSSIASYVLTGTSCSSSSCVVGQDLGLAINNSSSNNKSCITDKTLAADRFQISGGIINSSGAWTGVNCGTIFLDGIASKITQPDAKDSNCPALNLSFTAASGSQNCSCPIVSSSFTDPNKCLSNIQFGAIDPNGLSEFRGFLDSEASKLDPVSNNPARFTGDCKSLPAAPVYWYPGILGSAEIIKLNEQTGTSGLACDVNHPIIFQPGAYRFSPKVGTGGNCTTSNTSGCIWNLLSGTTVIGGVPNSNITECLKEESGVQFQFNYPFGINAKSGVMSLCNTAAAVISAPLRGAPADFAWDGNWRSNPIIEVPTANGNVFMSFKGMVYAPAGFANLSLNSAATVNFDGGAVFRAMTLTETGSFSSSTVVLPPPPFNGDRVVQLRFYRKSAIDGKQADLGMIQVVIRDYYGRRFASGYQILTWRAGW